MQVSDRGVFYLGRRVKRDGEVLAEGPFVYDPYDLTTHAVCVGMTGSGKTGLGIILIEEAALEGIPALVVDPKGDMTNLLLSFPDLRPESFAPWVDAREAHRSGLSTEAYAAEVARAWQDGLERWGIGGARIARLKESAEFVVYTPGSDAGRQVSIVQSLAVPPLGWDRDTEILREKISSTVSAILALARIESDPVTGREHSLLATIIEQAWRSGQDIELADLVLQVQKPPFGQLGVLPLEVFYPERERMSLTLALNGLLASPRFAAWLEGDPLRIDGLLRAPDGRPRISILSLAHLSDAERMFFVTLLLEQVRAWLRVQEGTPSLRAILYIDELYGFMPPHPANPPSKPPLLALLKQARSQGLGLVLATQNPVDLDYKGLSNAGTWFIGKLQTANDRQRVLEGLIGASMESGVPLDRSALDGLIARLDTRTFLLNNVHADGPELFRTRHTMSYLRGPLTRSQVRLLMSDRRRPVEQVAQRPALSTVSEPVPARKRAAPAQAAIGSPWDAFSPSLPLLPIEIKQYYVPARVALQWAIHNAEAERGEILYQDKQLVYRPAVLAQATVRIDDSRYNVHERLFTSRILPVSGDGAFIDWDAEPIVEDVGELDDRPVQEALFSSLPPLLVNARRFETRRKEYADHLYRESAVSLLHCPPLKLVAQPDESASQFRRRCYQAIRARSEEEATQIAKSYQTKVDRLEAQIRREERELEQDEIEYRARKGEEMLSAGESLLNLLSRRRSSRLLSVASRKRRLTAQSKAEVEESLDVLEDLDQQLEDLIRDREIETQEARARWEEAVEDLDGALQTIRVRPRKADVYVEDWGVAWLPYWVIVFEEQGAQKQLSLAAFESVGPPALGKHRAIEEGG